MCSCEPIAALILLSVSSPFVELFSEFACGVTHVSKTSAFLGVHLGSYGGGL